ncbi:ORF6N domain-containing protein [Pseudomonas petrae]|uniref:ORF6N domain-containing protein n=1 Tax=Pseudomonas petrae TaxID=2912190 RepID=UPI001F2B27F3|nr:ORF6N domain-containing protein [Pseudomonas petrae]MCF7557771.1 ORF6N domain-containing protein [Pseudomonas petrae]
MNIVINSTELPIVEYRGQRVVTFAMIDEIHGRPEGTASRTFTTHKEKLREDVDYFLADVSQKDVLRCFGIEVPNRGLTLIAEDGYLMLVKPFTDDLAWDVQRQLVNRYFRPAPPAEMSRLELLEIALSSEREKLRVTAERDEAVRTKAEIGSRREATAMATASAAVRQVQKLKDDLGLGTRQAAVLAVEKVAGRKFGVSGYVPLRRWCKERGVTAPKVFHPTFGFVRCWPAGAWLDVYQIDLADLFGGDGEQA